MGKNLVRALVPVTFMVATWILWELGGGEVGTREALRGTARIAFLPFILAFVARPLDDLRSSAFSRWLVANRKTLGVSFGLSLSIHLWLILWLFYLSAPSVPDAVTLTDLSIGAPGLAFVFAMVFTSMNRVRASMSAVLWKRIHTFGQYLVWFIFVGCLTESFGHKSPPYSALEYTPFIGALFIAMGIRLGAGLFGPNGRFSQKTA
ncbi:MAG: ferric reductase-like transmembrane domain-containing protein [Deltaproteobacteria bacterium]|nr:ferric reductase-like transmembrane domain-containing protein [Deltaproteobacteria bacterium]MBW2394113.1 ferric reductase-like transmembrane domain-containing protein [Deltaproteobacteria bacterium]